MINLESIKRIIKKGKMVLIPFGMIGATILTGCSINNSDSKITRAHKLGYEISSVDDSLHEFDGSLYKVEEFDACSSSGEYYHATKYDTIKKFGSIVGEENVTWNDIKETIKSRDFKDNYKDILLEGVNNLEKKLPNINLEVLNYNLKNINFENRIEKDENLSEEYTIGGLFDSISHSIYINDSDDLRYTLYHEVLGHALTGAYTDLNGGAKTSFSDFYTVLYNSNFETSDITSNAIELGLVFDEATAEIIAVLASGEKIYSIKNGVDGPYDIYIAALQLILTSTNTSFTDFVNNGTESILKKMKNAGCESPINYLMDLENRKQLYQMGDYFCSEEDLLSDQFTYYLLQILIDKYNKGMSVDEVVNFGYKCVDSINDYVIPTTFDGEYGVSWSNNLISEFIGYDQIKYQIENAFEGVKSYSLK